MVTLAALIGRMTADGTDLLVDAPENWSQGRTLYGGITAALCYEAAKGSGDVLPPLRSAQFTLIGPASGQIRLRPQLLRQGRSVRIIGVDAFAGDEIVARCVFAFGAGRDSRVAHDRAPPPAVTPADDSPSFYPSEWRPSGFLSNFELRLAAGARTFTPGAQPDLFVWVRHLDARDVDPTTALLALADALPPAAMVAFPESGRISTLTWTLDLALAPATGEGWHLLASSSQHSGEGYSLQDMALWDAGGDLVGAGRQLVAIFV
jgi:acyl-CoA thioesterase